MRGCVKHCELNQWNLKATGSIWFGIWIDFVNFRIFSKIFRALAQVEEHLCARPNGTQDHSEWLRTAVELIAGVERFRHFEHFDNGEVCVLPWNGWWIHAFHEVPDELHSHVWILLDSWPLCVQYCQDKDWDGLSGTLLARLLYCLACRTGLSNRRSPEFVALHIPPRTAAWRMINQWSLTNIGREVPW